MNSRLLFDILVMKHCISYLMFHSIWQRSEKRTIFLELVTFKHANNSKMRRLWWKGYRYRNMSFFSKQTNEGRVFSHKYRKDQYSIVFSVLLHGLKQMFYWVRVKMLTLGVSWADTTSKKEDSLLQNVTHPLDRRPENSATSNFYKNNR